MPKLSRNWRQGDAAYRIVIVAADRTQEAITRLPKIRTQANYGLGT